MISQVFANCPFRVFAALTAGGLLVTTNVSDLKAAQAALCC